MICLFMALALFDVVHGACVPTNWNYPWMKVGDHWFTRLDTARPWHEQMVECGKLEPGRSSIGSIQTPEGLQIISHRFGPNMWIGGFEIAGTGKWYWWNRGQVKMVTNPFWGKSEPDGKAGKAGCLHLYAGRFQDGNCLSPIKALCELRCK